MAGNRPSTGRESHHPAEYTLLFSSLVLFAGSLSWPLASNLSTQIHHRSPDLFGALNYYWWIGETLVRGAFTLHADTLFFPIGWEPYAYNSCFLDALLGGALAAGLGPVMAFNLLGLGIPAANSVVFIWFLSRRGFALSSSLPAGVWFGFNPYVLHEIAEGRLSQGLTLLIPMGVESLERFLLKPAIRTCVVSAGFLALATISYYFYGLFIAFIGLLFSSCVVANGPRGTRLRQYFRYGPLWLITFSLLVAPFGLPNLYSKRMSLLGLAAKNPNVLDIGTEALRLRHSIDLGKLLGNELDGKTALPLTMVAIACLGSIPLRRKGQGRLWLTIGVLFGVGALGPMITIKGMPLWSNPLHQLYHWALPLYTRFWYPYRLVVMIHFVLAWFLAQTVKRVSHASRHCPMIQLGLIRILWIMILLTVTVTAPHHQPVRIAENLTGYEWLRMQPPGGLIELPLDQRNSFSGLYYQTIHHKPLLLGSQVPPALMPQELTRLIASNHFLLWLDDLQSEVLPDISDAQLKTGLLELTQLGYAYLSFNPEFFMASSVGTSNLEQYYWMKIRLSELLEAQEFATGQVIYQLEQN